MKVRVLRAENIAISEWIEVAKFGSLQKAVRYCAERERGWSFIDHNPLRSYFCIEPMEVAA